MNTDAPLGTFTVMVFSNELPDFKTPSEISDRFVPTRICTVARASCVEALAAAMTAATAVGLTGFRRASIVNPLQRTGTAGASRVRTMALAMSGSVAASAVTSKSGVYDPRHDTR